MSTPTYVVELRVPGPNIYGPSPWCESMEWRVRTTYRGSGYGRPTEANLATYVKRYNASLEPGGANEHVGPAGRATAARIRRNGTNVVVATWTAPAFELI